MNFLRMNVRTQLALVSLLAGCTQPSATQAEETPVTAEAQLTTPGRCLGLRYQTRSTELNDAVVAAFNTDATGGVKVQGALAFTVLNDDMALAELALAGPPMVNTKYEDASLKTGLVTQFLISRDTVHSADGGAIAKKIYDALKLQDGAPVSGPDATVYTRATQDQSISCRRLVWAQTGIKPAYDCTLTIKTPGLLVPGDDCAAVGGP